MSNQNDRCPDCDGEGWERDGFPGEVIGECEKCDGTGLREARAGVGCAALVDALATALRQWKMYADDNRPDAKELGAEDWLEDKIYLQCKAARDQASTTPDEPMAGTEGRNE